MSRSHPLPVIPHLQPPVRQISHHHTARHPQDRLTARHANPDTGLISPSIYTPCSPGEALAFFYGEYSCAAAKESSDGYPGVRGTKVEVVMGDSVDAGMDMGGAEGKRMEERALGMQKEGGKRSVSKIRNIAPVSIAEARRAHPTFDIPTDAAKLRIQMTTPPRRGKDCTTIDNPDTTAGTDAGDNECQLARIASYWRRLRKGVERVDCTSAVVAPVARATGEDEFRKINVPGSWCRGLVDFERKPNEASTADFNAASVAIHRYNALSNPHSRRRRLQQPDTSKNTQDDNSLHASPSWFHHDATKTSKNPDTHDHSSLHDTTVQGSLAHANSPHCFSLRAYLPPISFVHPSRAGIPLRERVVGGDVGKGGGVEGDKYSPSLPGAFVDGLEVEGERCGGKGGKGKEGEEGGSAVTGARILQHLHRHSLKSLKKIKTTCTATPINHPNTKSPSPPRLPPLLTLIPKVLLVAYLTLFAYHVASVVVEGFRWVWWVVGGLRWVLWLS